MKRGSARLLEGALWVSALLCAAVLVSARVEAHTAAVAGQAIGATALQNATGPDVADGKPPENSGVIGRLEIARIGLTVPVLANYDPTSLKKGVGHIPGSAVPGGLGNLVLAGHRDTFFRPLRNVKPGMDIDIVDTEGRFRYRIDSTEIVLPDAVQVMDIGDRPGMTLITCYPFDFIGAAPKRFIVHAHLVSADSL